VSTASYNPNEARFPPTVATSRQASTTAGRNLGKSLNSHVSALSITHNGDLSCDLSKVSEDVLISAAQMGDQQAFMELCGRHSSVTKKKIFKIVRNHEDTEDALQDTLLRAYTHLRSFRRTCKFATWLTTIGLNTALTILRRRRVCKETSATFCNLEGVTVALEPVDRSPGPEAIYLKEQAIVMVRRQLKKLKPSLRSVVGHYYGTDCSLEEVAKEYKISLAAAKSRLRRGRNRLRSTLARPGLSKLDN
jgi:RNA polymerase sigma-70 factor (ECF subfamily)